MWACALGHQRAAELLYSWNSLALGIPDSLGRLPLAVARSRGHTRLAAALEELHTRRAQANDTPQPPPSPLSTSPDTGNTCCCCQLTWFCSLIGSNPLLSPSTRSQLLQQSPLTQRPAFPVSKLRLLQWPRPDGHLPFISIISLLLLAACVSSIPVLLHFYRSSFRFHVEGGA